MGRNVEHVILYVQYTRASSFRNGLELDIRESFNGFMVSLFYDAIVEDVHLTKNQIDIINVGAANIT